MLWVKSFHIVFVVAWFAGLFYLPRLFVYHALTTDSAGIERFKIMERKLYYGIMTPQRGAGSRPGSVALARLWHYWSLAAREARTGGITDCVSRILRQTAD